MDIAQVIATKRDGRPHSREEIEFLSRAAAGKEPVEEFHLTAWLMATYLNGLNDEETTWLTLAMANSGERLDLTGLPHPWVDKHSTGGVGDKTTLVLLPLLAACGLTVVKMSGRGLGITGGTIDKLESIPGFRTDLTPSEVIAQAGRIGLALTGQSASLAPADKTLYRLRDATGTVACIPLIVSSILSKKIAGGAEKLVLDVKCGSGGFMKTQAEATALAENLTRVAELAGISCRAVITDMNQPLGRAVGNALEVIEALDVLVGETGRFRDLIVRLAGITLAHSGIVQTEAEGEKRAEKCLVDGLALKKFDDWIVAQSGGLSSAGKLHSSLPKANETFDIHWNGPDTQVSSVNAFKVGTVAMQLGAGRSSKAGTIDHAVGIEVFTEVGARVSAGQRVFKVHSQTPISEEFVRRLLSSIA